MKNIYFLADAHLGSLAIPHQRTQERRLVRFLDSIKHKASAIYLLGDMFDFWNEYKYVVPKGYTRFLGKISELTDMGVEVHYFTGNHDIWTYGYLEKECGVILHTQPETVEIYDKIFFLAHGDGLGDPDAKFKFLRKMFHNRTCQKLLNFVHPWWGMQLGLNWAKHSRLKRADGKEAPFMGEDKEYLILFTKEYMKTHSNIDYFIFGHRHIELEMKMSRKTELVILGDWIWQFTYAVFDGEHMFIQQYIEGESKP
ncbi:MAG: UDP-2,3-diacylglucosamine diphosphatase [Prevotella sp.]|jgi:UDP-2,3-diacylglucosamine hydrolase|nr:UDP-2,3-diacylglucosamine diphosphatase [Prevotella sp.]MBQ1627149.1 UDP-2,3-diacylglucosamine diphosphatase [Prevotella sp.]MBQ1645542.1 UDP-2,3-diacylglucosamine diphosphatase [Prevotella sp.]MBQ1666500.1 UDP-2,3-diacylglucosamine diphosphatase [Prevotella sp.]MBQ1701747.1 UDP-2,3-diacylglucosamine diphosphatase [Prevotella sp.]